MKKTVLSISIVLLTFLSCKQTQEEKSEKGNITFTEIQLPEMENSSLPFLFTDGEELLLSFVSENDSLATLYFTTLTENGWSTPEKIASDTDWFVNWADYPQIAKNGDNYIAHFLQKSAPATFAYDVMVTQKQRGGFWSTPFKIHSDTTKTEHGFVSYAPYGENQFLVNWLDGRNTSGGHHDHHGGEPMTLRAAIVNPDGSLEYEFLLDNSVCDCCQTSSAMTAQGPVVVYRDRSEKEIRDISIVRYNGESWTKPVTVHEDNWEIAGCPVNGPRVDAINENVVTAWFTAAGLESKVFVSFSTNNGADFEKPVRIDTENPLGRVDVAFLNSETAIVLWIEYEEDETFIKYRTVTFEGQAEKVYKLASTSDSRASGFPQLAVFNGNVYFAWTTFEDENLLVKTGVITKL